MLTFERSLFASGRDICMCVCRSCVIGREVSAYPFRICIMLLCMNVCIFGMWLWCVHE